MQLFKDYELDDDRDRVDRDAVWTFLSQDAHWGRWRERSVVELQMDSAWRVVAAYDSSGRLVGFCRAVSDGFGMAYLADVFVIAKARGVGLGAALVRYMIEDGDGSGFRWMLHTDGAQGFYERLGFQPPDHRYLERRSPLSSAVPSPPAS
jgi:predicted N-acetyltransferase YhbS